jgi:hypothetical protein
MKAQRQPSAAATAAVTIGAAATPRFPKAPLTPIDRPTRAPAASTSIAVPIGW